MGQFAPPQEHGAHKNLKHTVTAEDVEDAEDLFLLAKERLLDVNQWGELAGAGSAAFQLTDTHGHEVHRHAHMGDHIKINIPGPGPEAGDGYDWVHVEKIAYDDYPDENGESMMLQVRPSSSPVNKEEAVAHFFKDDATSTFLIERHGKLLTASYYGRNEVPNTETDSIKDTVRNIAVAAGAMLGLSDIQWSKLVKGLLDFDDAG